MIIEIQQAFFKYFFIYFTKGKYIKFYLLEYYRGDGRISPNYMLK